MRRYWILLLTPQIYAGIVGNCRATELTEHQKMDLPSHRFRLEVFGELRIATLSGSIDELMQYHPLLHFDAVKPRVRVDEQLCRNYV